MEKYTILIVDDDPMANIFSTLMIKKQNPYAEIVTFNSATDALSYLKNPVNEKPDVIFLDLNMPVMNGWDFMNEYQNIDVNIEVIIVSSSNEYNDRERCKSYKHIKDFFVKPISMENLQHYFLRR